VTRPHVVVVRVRDHAVGPDGRAATEAALAAQTYPDWTRVDGPADPAGTGLLALPADPAYPDDADDVLVVTLPDGAVPVPDALARIAEAVAPTGARLVTWDLDTDAGTPVLRFGWSPEVLLSADYTQGCFALRLADYRAAAAAVGAADHGADTGHSHGDGASHSHGADTGHSHGADTGHSDGDDTGHSDGDGADTSHSDGGVPLTTWSLLLHLPVDLAPTVHLSLPLTSTPAPAPAADADAARVVDAGLRWRGVPARCERAGGVTRLRWEPREWPGVTIVVPTRHNEPLLGPLLESLRDTRGPAFDVLVVDNGGRTPEHEAWYDRDHGFNLRVIWWEETPFHYGRVNNAAVADCDSDVVVLLNDDTRVRDPQWLAELVGLATMPGVGCAGMALLDGHGKLQHAGVWLGIGGFAGHLFGGLQPGEPTLLGPTSWYRNTLAVTAACLAIRRQAYLEVGGLDELMVLCGSDVTLGLDQVALGRRNVCSPLAGVVHLESVTRSSAPLGDQLVSLMRYQPWHDGGDPYGNRRLSLGSTRPRLRRRGEADPVAAARARLGVAL
jgi:GT2 family glycosyltransferase